jgi:uncharacterized membrane protein
MNNKNENLNWLAVGIAAFVIFPPIGLLVLLYGSAKGKITGLPAKITYIFTALIVLIVFLVFVVFHKTYHLA